jgi:uncharacterized membrane protein YkoI
MRKDALGSVPGGEVVASEQEMKMVFCLWFEIKSANTVNDVKVNANTGAT